MLTSTSPDEEAWFITQGSVSYSNFFWMQVFNGLDLASSHIVASEAMAEHQTPLLDANGNGIGNEQEDYDWAQTMYIGNGTVIYGDSPTIVSVSDDQTITGQNWAELYADGVTDDDGVARVWAVIRPPNYNQGSSDNPVQEFPSIDLLPVGGDRYEATYEGFSIPGDYIVAIYARDAIGNTSVPSLTTVTVVDPLRRRAIILASGVPQTDPLWPAIEKGMTQAYEALRFQCYTDEEIYFMSPVVTSNGLGCLLGALEPGVCDQHLGTGRDPGRGPVPGRRRGPGHLYGKADRH